MSNQHTSYFCPGCGSSAVDVPLLVGGVAACRTCAWRGPTTELLGHTFSHDLGTEEEILSAFLRDFKQLMGSVVALPLARLLAKWGFFESGAPTPAELTRYVAAMGKASIAALYKERESVERERVGANEPRN